MLMIFTGSVAQFLYADNKRVGRALLAAVGICGNIDLTSRHHYHYSSQILENDLSPLQDIRSEDFS